MRINAMTGIQLFRACVAAGSLMLVAKHAGATAAE
jgi:hypothetical protein